MYREEDVKAIVLMLMAAAVVLGIPVAAVFGAYCSYQNSKEFCNKQGNEYNFELFGSSICEADDAGKKEVLESKLAEHLPVKQYKVKDYRIVNRVKNPDGSYTMEVVGQYEGKDMEYHGVFRNVVSKKEYAERVAKESKIVREAFAKAQADMCNDLAGKKYIKSVKYDAETNTCIIVSEEPVIYRESRNGINFVNSSSVPFDYWPAQNRLIFTDATKKEAEGKMEEKYLNLKENDESFKDFVVDTSNFVEVPNLKVTFPNTKTFSEDFAEKCANDENCTCKEDGNGKKVCEKHITQLVLVTKDPKTLSGLEDIASQEIGYPDYNDREFNDNGERVVDCSSSDSMECFGLGEDHVVKPQAFIRFDDKIQKFVIEHANVRLVFDNVKTVSNKTYDKHLKCQSNGWNSSEGWYNRESTYKCAKSVMTENPQALCLDTYWGAKYKNSICEVPFDGKVSKLEDLKKDFESCKINKIIAGKGNTATANAVCNGLRVNINMKNYQVQKRTSKGR